MWEDILIYIVIGFAAQMVDGAIGMAYGITSSSVLLSFGMPPATVSACVHAAETFTTAASGTSHWKLGNIDKALVWKLAVPGVIGGIAGAYLLTKIDGNFVKPFVSAYLLLLGFFILWKALRTDPQNSEPPDNIVALGLIGGFMDSIGGGGWGPIVTTSLIGQGTTPRYAIGSVNLAEFFVTAAISGTFFLTVGFELWPIIAGLIIGGVVAAPFAAVATKSLPDKTLMIIVGCVVILLSLRTLLVAVHL